MNTPREIANRAHHLAAHRHDRAIEEWARAHADNIVLPSPEHAAESARLEARMNKAGAARLRLYSFYLATI